MLMRILAPRRPDPAPVAGTFPGVFLSLTAHAALLAAAVGGHGAAARGGAGAAPTSGGEQLHWVGVREGAGARGTRRPRAGALPPIAYVVPGRGAPSVYRLAAHAPRAGTSGRDGPRDAVGRNAVGRDAAPRGDGPGAPPAVLGSRLPGGRRSSPPRFRPAALQDALRDMIVPAAEATRLIAGVVAAAPDLARRVSRPEEFLPASASDLLTQTGVGLPALLRSDVHVNDVPIPLVSNPTPAYPAALARAGVRGEVVVEFLIDSTGVVDLGSLRVVESTNALFAQAVRGVLPRLRFTPAQRGDHAVGVTVRQPFLFTVRAGL